MKNRRFICSLLFVLAIICGFANFGLPVAAAGEDPVGFYVKAVLPKNQRDNRNTFFDLRAENGQTQRLEIIVGNIESDSIVVNAVLNDATTNKVGSIDYNGGKSTGANLVISKLASFEETTLAIASGEKKSFYINLEIPKEGFDGQLLGGITITKEQKGLNIDEGISLENVYSYVIGLLVSQEDVAIAPVLSMNEVKPETLNYRTAIVHKITNLSPILVDKLSMNIEIYREGETSPIWSAIDRQVRMAPLSTMDYAFYVGDSAIEPGEYRTYVTIKQGEREWNFKESFIIENKMANSLNENSVYTQQVPQNTTKLKMVAVALIAIVIILVISAIFLLASKNKSTKERTDNNEA